MKKFLTKLYNFAVTQYKAVLLAVLSTKLHHLTSSSAASWLQEETNLNVKTSDTGFS